MPNPRPPASRASGGVTAEEDLVAEAQAGARQAFDGLATEAMPMLLGTAMRLLGDRLAAEEVVADALYRAYRKLDHFDGRSRFSTWAHRILCRAVADRIRDEVRARTRRGKLFERGGPPPRPTALEHLQADEKSLRLRAAAEDLPPTQRLVILLVVWEGLSLQDVAEVTGLRYRTVKSNLNHARNALKRAIEEEVSS